MMTCDYSFAPDCSECDLPVCRRDIYHSPNDYDDPYDDADGDEEYRCTSNRNW